MGLGRNYSNTS